MTRNTQDRCGRSGRRPAAPCWLLFAGLLALTLLAWRCAERPETRDGKEGFEIEKVYTRGPVTFTLKVSRKEITIADHLHLALQVRFSEDYEVKLPEFGEKLEQFGIVDYQVQPPRLIEEGVLLSGKIYELSPFLSGEYRIPPMTITFFKKGEEEKEHALESEELTITVKSLLPEATENLSIKEIAGPMSLPGPDRRWLAAIIAACLLGAGGVIALVRRRMRRSHGEEAARRAPHEIAYEALESLLSDKLLDAGKVKAFYLRLSRILRHYIEDRFTLRAPERTTEEFLGDLRSSDALVPAHKSLLKAFLVHCDMVKFAEHQPTTAEIQEAFDACKRFIAETEVRKEPQKPTVAAAAG